MKTIEQSGFYSKQLMLAYAVLEQGGGVTTQDMFFHNISTFFVKIESIIWPLAVDKRINYDLHFSIIGCTF